MMYWTLDDIVKRPKIDLHRHLSGSLRMETQMEIAREYSLDLPHGDLDSFRRYVKFDHSHPPDLLEFLKKFHSDWYFSLEIIERFAYEAIHDAARDNIVYMELRFSPAHFARLKKFPEHETTEAILRGCERARKETGIMLKYIVTLGRHKQAPHEHFHTLDVAADFRDEGVVAIDLAGDEINHPPEKFIKAFDYAKSKYGFKFSIHAGEVAGPEHIKTTIQKLYADRIGHGVTSIKSEEIMDMLVERKIPLEMCLTSNLQTGAVTDLSKHPCKELMKRGVVVTLNSDDPQISDITLSDDYYLAVHKVGLGPEDLRQLLVNSVAASFAGDEEKKEIAARLGISEFYINSLKK